MPRKKAKINAAKIRLNKQNRNSNIGKFLTKSDEFIFTYSNDDFITKRLSLIWSNDADNKVKKSIYWNNEILRSYIKIQIT